MVLIVGFVATPFILEWLGEERFGAFRAASDWFAYLGLLELGVSGALLALLARGVGQGDAQATRNTLAAGVWWYIRIAAVMITAGIGLSLAITLLVPVKDVYAADLRRGVLIGLLSVALFPLGAPFKALAESRQRGYWINALLLLQSLSVTAGALALASAGWGITGQFVALAFGTLLFNVPLIWDGLRRYPGVLRSAVRDAPDPEAQRGLRQLNTPTFLYNLSGRFSFETDNIIVAFMLGPTAVVPLFITQKLIMIASGQLVSVGNASWAALAELHFQGHRELFNRRLIELTSLVAVFGVAGLVPIAIYNRYFVAQWVGPEHYGGNWVSIIAAVVIFIRAVVSLWGWCFGGTARTPLLVRASVVETLINVSLSVVLTWRLGLVGPLLGTLVGLVTVSLWYLPKLLHEIFGTPVHKLSRAVLSPVVVGLPYAGAVWWVANSYKPTGWFDLGAHMAAAVFVYLAFWWSVMLGRERRTRVTERAMLILRQRAA